LSYAPTVGVWLEGQTKIIASDRGFAVAIRRLPSRILVLATGACVEDHPRGSVLM